MKWIYLIIFVFFLAACHSTAKYRAIKNSRQSGNQNYSHKNTDFQRFINSWLGVPYKYGGMNKRGIDCSGFTFTVYKELYDYNLPRTALDQYKSGKKINTGQLTEGDLVFFRGVRGAGIDHVGVFLENGKFVHASTSVGVIISDLSEEYYKIRYVGACRY